MRNPMVALGLALVAVSAVGGQWVTEGFESFRRGSFGNAGQNLYVSKAGVLQRIYQFDLDHNGWFDLPYANCQDHHESAPSYLYALDGKRTATLPGQGARSGVAVDLNGDGYQDLVVCNNHDAVAPFASTDVYYGSESGYSEKFHIRLQTPRAEDCWFGDFTRSHRPALVFAMPEFHVVRIYEQTELGFEWAKFKDLKIEANLLTATDLDGDGFDDLVLRKVDETRTVVCWGGKDGLSAERQTVLPELPASEVLQPEEAEGMQSELERRVEAPRLLQSVVWKGRKCFTLSTGKKVLFYSSGKDRALVRTFEVEVPSALAVTVGDFNRDGQDDLAFASDMRHPTDPKLQQSYIWLGAKDGFRPENRIAVTTRQACCVDSEGDKVLFGQSATDRLYTNDALLFSFEGGTFNPEPRRFVGEDMRRAFFVKNRRGGTFVFLVNHYSRSAVGCDRAFLYWGDKDGYRPDRVTALPGWCSVDTIPADFDDDGWAELVVCNNSENAMHLDPGHHLHHFGPKGFEPERTVTLKTDLGWGGVAADFDRDGYLDLVTSADHWYGLRFFYGGPDGFARTADLQVQPDDPPEKNPKKKLSKDRANMRHPYSGSCRWPAVADLNGDGWLDLVIPMIKFDRSHILWGGPQGFSMARRQDLCAYRCVSACIADLDGNGYPDVIFGAHTSQPDGQDAPYRQPHHSYLHIYWNDYSGLSETRKSLLRCDAGDSITVADFNGDGTLDIFTGSYLGELDRDINSFLYWNRGGCFREFDRQEFMTHTVSGCIGADFNHDGYIDLAVANHKVYGDHVGDSYVYWNGPKGFAQEALTKLPTRGPHGMCSAEPGNVMTRGPEEYYYSERWTAESDLTVEGIAVSADVPPNTWVKTLLSVNGDGWKDPAGLKVQKGDRLQYRLELGAFSALRTPRVTKVVVSYK